MHSPQRAGRQPDRGSASSLAIVAAVLIGVVALGAPAAHADECWLYPPAGYAGIGGASTLGPYRDYYEALRINNEYFEGWGSIECSDSEHGGDGSDEFQYGAAKFHNNTTGTVEFSVQRGPNGDWESVRVEPGYWYWWWQECPCRFHAQWDASWAGGFQDRTREIGWYGFAYQPSETDARDWQFVERASEIVLVEGSTAPPSQPVTVSLVGHGEGAADAAHFGAARSASGAFQIDFMPRVAGVIPTIRGAWEMRWQRTLSSQDDAVHEAVWVLSTTDLHGMGSQTQAVEFTLHGGVGTAEFWTTRVPQHDAAGIVDVRVHIQFSGGNVRLSFDKAF